MQTIVKAADDAALLALMPHLIGMHPRNSVVLLGFQGNRTYGGLRFDLPVPTGTRPSLVYKRVAKALVGMLGKLPEADGVVIAVVTDEEFGQSATPPQLEFATELTRCVDRSRFELKGVLCQAADGWAPYFDHGVPAGGYPLSDLADSHIDSLLPSDVPDLFDAAAAPPRVPDAPVELRSFVMSEVRRLRAQINQRPLDETARELSDDPHTFVRFAERALNLTDEEFPSRAAHYRPALQGSRFGDAMMLEWASDGQTGLRLWDEIARFDLDRLYAESEFVEMLNGQSSRPDHDRLDRAIKLMVKLVSCAEDALRPWPLVTLAWLHWAMGRGSMASVYLAEALLLAPENIRARDLDSLLRSGAFPAWLFESYDDERDDDQYEEDEEVDDGWLNDDDFDNYDVRDDGPDGPPHPF